MYDDYDKLLYFNVGDRRVMMFARKSGFAIPVDIRRLLWRHCRPHCTLVKGKFVSRLDTSSSAHWVAHLDVKVLPFMDMKSVMFQILLWVYTGWVGANQYGHNTILDTCAVAQQLGLEEIVWDCEHCLRMRINKHNVYAVMKGAHDRETRLTEKVYIVICFCALERVYWGYAWVQDAWLGDVPRCHCSLHHKDDKP